MKIVLSRSVGGPESLVLEHVEEPVAGPGQVLIRVHACGVNFPDSLVIADRYQIKPPRPFAPGSELAGVVEAVGEHVTEFSVGDRVIAVPGWGGMAEKLVADVSVCTRMPDQMSYDQGACFIATYGTAYHAFKQRARLRSGERLLVLGAGGGIGLASVQIGRAMGAHVIGAASTQEKLDLALSAGAESGVVYPMQIGGLDERRRLSELFKDICGPAGADVICDSVGGAYTEAALRAIAWGGRFLVVGFPAGIPSLPLNLALLKGCDIAGVIYGAYAQRDPAGNAANIRELMALFAAGKICPHISAHYPMEAAGQAISDLAGRRALGKSVIRIKSPAEA